MKKTLRLLPLALLLFATSVGCKKEDKDLDTKTPTDTTKKTIPELLTDGKTVQFILDEGYTPKEIYDNDSTYFDSIFGKTYQAGLIFYFNTDGTGMVAAPTDDRTNYTWGCSGNDLSGAYGSAVGTGKQNTIDILAGCSTTSIAANACDTLTLGGYTDWFLPSINELNQINYKLENNGLGAFGSMYWSSTETSANNAEAYRFSSGTTPSTTKYGQLYVRAVREF